MPDLNPSHRMCVVSTRLASATRLPGKNASIYVLLVSLLIASAVIPAGFCKTDPETHRIRVIFLGEVKPISFPFPGWIESDPKFTLQRVPCDVEWFSEADAKRFTRLYLPRTYRALVEGYDAAIFEDFTPNILPPGALDNFQRAISEEGLGIVLVEFVFWSQNLNRIDVWKQVSFGEVLPADPTVGSVTSIGRAFYKVLRSKPILNLPGIERWPMNAASHGDMYAKEGAVTHAVWKTRGTDAVVSRPYGRGMALQIAHGWDNIPSSTVVDYDYLPDLIFNEIYFVAQVEPPEDLAVVHSLRTGFLHIVQRRKAALSLIEFVDRFGARTSILEEKLIQLNQLAAKAEREYIDSNYEASRETLDRVLSGYDSLDQLAVEVKRRALMWIYTVEWVATTATLIICLEAVWMLMVKRRAYKAVDSTRMKA